MTDKTSFTISYCGKALDDNAMDVKDLAPALLSFGSLFSNANRIINGDKASINTKVRAYTPGSFGVEFEVTQGIVSHIKDWVSGESITHASDLKNLLFGSGFGIIIGLVALIRKLRGRRADSIEENKKNDTITITINDEKIQISTKVYRLYVDQSIRVSVENMVKPIVSEGVDKIVIKEGDKTIEEISKEELDYFIAPSGVEAFHETELTMVCTIVNLSFKENTKWKLYDGNSTFNASMMDEDFSKAIDRGEISFSKGDTLVCRIKMTQYQESGKIKNDYQVLKVEKHIKKSKSSQLSLNNV